MGIIRICPGKGLIAVFLVYERQISVYTLADMDSVRKILSGRQHHPLHQKISGVDVDLPQAVCAEPGFNRIGFQFNVRQIILPDQGPDTRATFMRQMAVLNVGTGFHYAPIHLFSLYRARGFAEGMFPHAEKIGRLTVTLPMFYAMTLADVERAVAAVKTILLKEGTPS